MKLYSYWRSSAAYRVRIALNLKGLDHEIAPVHLLRDGGEQHQRAYRSLNPQEVVPTLVDGALSVGQSLAIIEYLEARYPQPALYPPTPDAQALARQFALIIACDIHPLNNLRVLKYLKRELHQEQAASDAWYRHWIQNGFRALEQLLANNDWQGPYCLGEQVTVADVCLLPQLYNAHRFRTPMDDFSILLEVEKACMELEAFRQAAPENQIDANT